MCLLLQSILNTQQGWQGLSPFGELVSYANRGLYSETTSHWEVLKLSFNFAIILYLVFCQVAEILINPFGDDDDDFDCNHIVDSNYERSRAIVVQYSEDEEEKEEEDLDDAEMPESLPNTLKSYKHQEVNQRQV